MSHLRLIGQSLLYVRYQKATAVSSKKCVRSFSSPIPLPSAAMTTGADSDPPLSFVLAHPQQTKGCLALFLRETAPTLGAMILSSMELPISREAPNSPQKRRPRAT